jgi:pimeloyl-ACP methyl ester carboxylesterase
VPVARNLYYFAHGAENYHRPPVLLIHGAGGHHLSWPPQVRRLPGQRIFAPDLPGHGRSEGVGHQRIQDYADEILAFMTDLRLNAAVLIGHSMGAAIVLQIAIRSPNRALGLGLLGAGARLRVDSAILRHASHPADFPAAIRLIGERSFGPEAAPGLRDLALKRMTETRPAVLYGDLQACDQFDVRGELANLHLPTVILCGSQDQMTPPKYSTLLHENISGSTLRVLQGAGHMVMLEQPDAVADALADFLDSIAYRPGQ